ncbi:hypothetical protein [Microbulbifer thermotolerans]|uniref:hypothetical protein n=1 Tax=Microbulbifer thermotolerans TaxID=252514 RepID=UPI0022499704|nr:hypothetical protein [Microbulbifer thermotolerans]MCX2778227.1 hypothetical protein [Microbulbifer thermotolerans]MCX2803568.1 hypothetical protein [Microbulbifer thermotolerans]MCX2829958.1 hypothetical protein [Microbulbifer thermotolerans]MCX2841427.1 hypothetical protein [Microbulbifer thermotolerans]WKT61481.1 hypothetical protein Q2E61_04635 [Microbulbifer thermotolerans]
MAIHSYVWMNSIFYEVENVAIWLALKAFCFVGVHEFDSMNLILQYFKSLALNRPPPKISVTGPERVLATISHELGHSAGLSHPADNAKIRELEINSVLRSRR